MRFAFTPLLIVAFCVSATSRAEAGFTLITDPASFATNDRATWGKFFDPPGRFAFQKPMISDNFGIAIPWGETDHSRPFQNTLVQDQELDLFIGTAVTKPSGPDTASFDLFVNFDPESLVLGAGAFFRFVSAGESTAMTLTATDASGDSTTFDLPNTSGFFVFLGVQSDVPLTRLEVSDAHFGLPAASTVIVLPLSLEIATPAPPSLLLAAIGGICLALSRARRYWLPWSRCCKPSKHSPAKDQLVRP